MFSIYLPDSFWGPKGIADDGRLEKLPNRPWPGQKDQTTWLSRGVEDEDVRCLSYFDFQKQITSKEMVPLRIWSQRCSNSTGTQQGWRLLESWCALEGSIREEILNEMRIGLSTRLNQTFSEPDVTRTYILHTFYRVLWMCSVWEHQGNTSNIIQSWAQATTDKLAIWCNCCWPAIDRSINAATCYPSQIVFHKHEELWDISDNGQKTYKYQIDLAFYSLQYIHPSIESTLGWFGLTVQDECKELRKFHCCVKCSLVGSFLGMFAKHFKHEENLERLNFVEGFL